MRDRQQQLAVLRDGRGPRLEGMDARPLVQALGELTRMNR